MIPRRSSALIGDEPDAACTTRGAENTLPLRERAGIIKAMKPDIGEPVPYTATAVRLGIDDLPPAVRTAIETELGGAIVRTRTAGAGFSGGFAAVVESERRKLFIKAAGPDLPYVNHVYGVEGSINRRLPASVPAPRILFDARIDDWVVIGFEAINGSSPDLPASPHQWRLMLDAWARAAEALTPAPQGLLELGIPTWEETDLSSLRRFTAAADGHADIRLPERAAGHLDELIALESSIGPAVTANAVMHGDLRPDNIVITDDAALICDWNWPSIGAPWFDTVGLLVPAHGGGLDAEAMFREHPTSTGVDDDQLNTVLAAIAGYYLAQAELPPPDRVSPYLRPHQRWSGLATLDWLANRRGW